VLRLQIQALLGEPNIADPAQMDAYVMCRDNRRAYEDKVRSLAKKYAEDYPVG
jgi:ubiquitin-protein ligase